MTDPDFDFISCSEIAKVGYPKAYGILQQGLEAIGYRYDIATDGWYKEKEMASKKTLCVDFDGVIHSYTSGWQGHATIEDPPVEGAIPFLYDALNTFKVAIYSSRSSSQQGISAMQDYIAKHAAAANFNYGQPWWLQLEWPVNKPSAWVTIDDRAICFTGEWPSMSELSNFEPWHLKRPSSLATAMAFLNEVSQEEKGT